MPTVEKSLPSHWKLALIASEEIAKTRMRGGRPVWHQRLVRFALVAYARYRDRQAALR